MSRPTRAYGVPGGMELEDDDDHEYDDGGFYFGDADEPEHSHKQPEAEPTISKVKEEDTYNNANYGGHTNPDLSVANHNDERPGLQNPVSRAGRGRGFGIPSHEWQKYKAMPVGSLKNVKSFGSVSTNTGNMPTSASSYKRVAVAAGYEDSDEDEFFLGDETPYYDDDRTRFSTCDAQPQFPDIHSSGTDQAPETSQMYQNVQTTDSRITNSLSNSQVQSEENLKRSIFSKTATQQTISEEINLEGENIRMAVVKGNVEYIRKALKAGFKPESKIKSGWTALMFAAHSCFPEIVDILIEYGSNANFQKDMFTPLMTVCTSTRNVEEDLVLCAEKIVSAGGRVNAHDRHLMTPLMYASQNGKPELVKFLLSKQADINKQDTRQWSALCFAASSGHTHVVKVLLENKANSKLCANDGQSPADLAYATGYTALASILEGSDDVSVDRLGQVPPTATRKPLSDKTSQGSRYVKYGDLELILCGLELAHLVPLFQEHELSFQDFLKITEKDLIQIGINQLGARQKILEAIRSIHTNEWDLSSLNTDKAKLSTLEAAAIIANVTKHLTCIQSSVDYLKDYIEEARHYIKEDDPTLQRTLCRQCKEATDAAKSLEERLSALQQDLGKQLPKAKQRPPDLIDETSIPPTDSNQSRLFLLAAGTFLLGIGSVIAYNALREPMS